MNPPDKLAAAALVAATLLVMAAAGADSVIIGDALHLATNKSVQREVKATDEQARELDALAAVLKERRMTRVEATTSSPLEQRNERIVDLLRESDAELRDLLSRVLKPEQVARFDQITLQVDGLRAFRVDRVREALKLTGTQEAKRRQLNSELQSGLRKLAIEAREFAGDRQTAYDRVAEVHRLLVGEFEALLTAEQREAWKVLVGEPFELELNPPGLPPD